MKNNSNIRLTSINLRSGRKGCNPDKTSTQVKTKAQKHSG